MHVQPRVNCAWKRALSIGCIILHSTNSDKSFDRLKLIVNYLKLSLVSNFTLCFTICRHDNSITSDPSEATNTISDDATVLIKTAKLNQPKPASPNTSNEDTTPYELNDKSKKCAKAKPEQLEVSQIEVYQILGKHKWTWKLRRHYINKLNKLLDSIRQTTNLSHELSCVALKVVLSELETIYSTPVLEFIEPIAKHFTAEQLSAPDEFIEHTHDSHRLKLIFGQLAECKNDSEQRTWMLHEDEDYIVQFLTELIDILVSLLYCLIPISPIWESNRLFCLVFDVFWMISVVFWNNSIVLLSDSERSHKIPELYDINRILTFLKV